MDQVDEWNIDFTIGEDYRNMDSNAIKEKHSKYVVFQFVFIINKVVVDSVVAMSSAIIHKYF